MGHLVQCRGGEWHLDRAFPAFSATRRVGRSAKMGWLARLGLGRVERFDGNWNATPFPIDLKSFEPGWSRSHPAWAPVALLCCEVDVTEGSKFASAILDADPDDDTPALIASEWLEERGACGAIAFDQNEWAGRSDTAWRQQSAEGDEVDPAPLADDYFPGGMPEEWEWILHRRLPSKWEFTGPLASWCRSLIATRCLACGGRRDGSDRKNLAGLQFACDEGLNSAPRWIFSTEENPRVIVTSDRCLRCGISAHPTPQSLEIPGVVKPETRR